MREDELIFYGLIFFAGLFIAIFEVYRNNSEIWKLKRYIDKKVEREKAEMYKTACNTFAQNCKYLFQTGVLAKPDEWEGTEEELILNNFFVLVPEAKNYLVPKEQGYDVRLEDSDSISQGRSES